MPAELRIKGAKETTSDLLLLLGRLRACSCPPEDGKVIQIEGDPDHPINEGSLCPKGASVTRWSTTRTAC